MARHRSSDRPAAELPEADRLRSSHTLSISVHRGGTLVVMLGRMDMTTRRYSFTRLRETTLPGTQKVPLHWVAATVAALIQEDPEVRKNTA